MATAEELLTASEEDTLEILTVDLNTRIISIPTTLKILGVESDDDVKRLQFIMPRFYGEFDMSEFHVCVNFQGNRTTGDTYPVKDVTVGDDLMWFSWLVDRTAYKNSGDVKFSLCLKLYDDTGVVVKELNTTYASLPVLEGLETTTSIVENNPSAFDTVLYRLYAVEAATGNGQNGYYSVVQVTQRDDGVLFSIVNQDGETIAFVRHGTDGTDGKDGYSPVKGVDYWTEADESEIKQELSDITQQHINTWAPRSTKITLYSSDWTDNQQTVAVSGVTANNIVVVAPEPTYDNYKEYAEQNVRCVSQSDGYLTFERTVISQDVDLTVIVAIYYSGDVVADRTLTVTDDGEGNVTIVV